MQFGSGIDSRRALWKKIEKQAAAREAEKLAAGKASRNERLVAMREARRKHRARVTRRELANHRVAAMLRAVSRPDSIIDEVAARHGLTRHEIISPRKWNRFVAARQELCWRLYCETSLSSLQIGQRLHKDHTSVLHAVGCWMRRHNLELPTHRLELSQRYQPNG